MEPTSKQISQYLAAATLASKKAGHYLKRNFQKSSPSFFRYKKDSEIITGADLAANRIIVEILRKKFPGHNIVSEEKKYKKTSSPFRWYIDPLDGTTNYAAGSPLFSVNIALEHKNEPLLGVIYLPHMDELYWAVRHRGAHLNKKKIRVSKTNKLKDAFLLLGHGYLKKEQLAGIKVIKKINGKCRVYRRWGCAGLDLVSVAAGRADALIATSSRSWDNLAGAMIVNEAGGRATDLKNKYFAADSQDLLATNGKLHARILNIIK